MSDDDGNDDEYMFSQVPAVMPKSIDDYISGKYANSPLIGQGANFIKRGAQYNIDPRLMVAIAGAESGFGKNLDTGANNPFGLLYAHPDPYNSNFDSWDHAIKGLGRSLTKDGYDLSNTAEMYNHYCQSGNCSTGLDNINRFMQEQGADPNALYFPFPPSQD